MGNMTLRDLNILPGVNHNKAEKELSKSEKAYKAAVKEANIARANCNLPPKAPKDPKQFFMDKALEKGSQFLTDIGVESINSDSTKISVPLYPAPKQVSSTYAENQMEKASQGLPTDKILAHAGHDGLTFKNTEQKPTQEKPRDISVLLPKTETPMQMEKPVTGGGNWQSYRNYRDALTMQTVENAIAVRSQRQIEPPRPLDLDNPTKSIEAEHKKIWGQGFLEHSQSPLERYRDADLSQSNIPTWLRHLAGADHLSLDPQERIEMNSQQLVTNIHSIGKIFGEMM